MKRALTIVCCMLTVFFSCTHHRKAEIEAVRTQSQQHFDIGEYQQALDGYRGLYARFPDEPDLAGRYIDMVEIIKKQSDKAYARGKYATADKIYRLLLDDCDHFSGYQKKLSFSKSFLNERIRLSQIKLAENTSRQCLSSGDFQKAIDVCREIFRKYRKDDQAQKCLMTAAEELGETGNTAFNNREYAAAGRIYRVLRENAKIFKMAKIFAPPDLRTINAKLANCSTYLNRKGLELYRMGNLSKAVVVWEDILEFDPNNADVKKVVDSTSDHIKNMQLQCGRSVSQTGAAGSL